MLRIKNQVPKVYYSESRDFQVLGKTLDIIQNSVKSNIDLMLADPTARDSQSKLLDLLSLTLGFELAHTYTNEDLSAICEFFIELYRKKGTKEAIEEAVRILANRQNIFIDESIDIVYLTKAPDYIVEIYIPSDLENTIILDDLMNYILPAGWTYRFIKYFSNVSSDSSTNVYYKDRATNKTISWYTTSKNQRQITHSEDNQVSEGSEVHLGVIAEKGTKGE